MKNGYIKTRPLISAFEEELKCRRFMLSDGAIDVLEELLEYLKGRKKIRAVELVMVVVQISERKPAWLISNLLILLEVGSHEVLDAYVISNCGRFMRNFLKHDEVIRLLSAPASDEDEQESLW